MSGVLECKWNLGILLGDDRSTSLVQSLKFDQMMLMDAQACIHASLCSGKASVMQMLSTRGNLLDLVCPASTAINAMSLVCQARTALADSIRQTAGWLGHSSAQSTSTAKLLQVCQLYIHIAQ